MWKTHMYGPSGNVVGALRVNASFACPFVFGTGTPVSLVAVYCTGMRCIHQMFHVPCFSGEERRVARSWTRSA
jgi:hypothetical protein